MNLLSMIAKFNISFKAVTDPERAPHAYLIYLLIWTFIVGIFVLFVFPIIGNTLGFIVIGLMIISFVLLVWYFNNKEIFAD